MLLAKYFTRKFSIINKNKQIFTGIQPTGSIHLGNYLGAIAGILKMQQQQKYANFYVSIVDLHSLTTAVSHQHSNIHFNFSLGQNSKQMVKTLLGSGIDSSKITIFIQSHIKQHSELCWILSCLCPQHWLNTMIQYRQKRHEESSVGVYTYPILMAADIMLYKATHVPVGQDQSQHLELTRKISQRFNKCLNTQFFVPVTYVQSRNSKVLSLSNPTKKMSKSQASEYSRIHLSDSKDAVRNKIRKAVTDSLGNSITYDPVNRLGLSNLIQIYSGVKDQEIKVTLKQIEGLKISQFKDLIVLEINKILSVIQERMESISDEDVSKVLKQGQKKAQLEASENMKQIKALLKLYQ